MINVIVGPPAAGKSEYVKGRAKDGEVVIDYDLIAKAMGSRVAHDADRLGSSCRIECA